MKKLYLLFLLFLFLLPTELLAQCVSSIALNSSVSGNWVSSCASTHRTNSYAKYYTFTLANSQQVTISLDSSVDTYLFLLNGSNETGSVIAQNDDISENDTDSQIVRTLAAGTYTVEATTFNAATTGSFVVAVSAGSSSGACIKSINTNTSVSDSWISSCASTHRAGRYAKYFTFSLASSQQVTISLDSSVDTYLYLLSGSTETGSVIAENDDIASGDTDSQIVRTLAAGTYTIEATTFNAATTGNFVVSVSAGSSSGACIKSINTDTTVNDSWVSTCSSTHRSGRYAKFFTFSLASSRRVTIDLQSAKDTYLYLLSGSTQTGSVIAENDDIGSGVETDSQIVRTLAAGTYTIEATTYEAATTGTFTVRVDTACSDCPFEINAGLNDAWYSTATNGQGLTVTVFPERKEVFVAWFTFDTVRPPSSVTANLGDPGHRWLTAQGPYSGDKATLTIFVTEGGVFDSAQPATTTSPDGSMILEFADCTEGLVRYEIDSLGISGEIPIERIVDDNVALCEELLNN